MAPYPPTSESPVPDREASRRRLGRSPARANPPPVLVAAAPPATTFHERSKPPPVLGHAAPAPGRIASAAVNASRRAPGAPPQISLYVCPCSSPPSSRCHPTAQRFWPNAAGQRYVPRWAAGYLLQLQSDATWRSRPADAGDLPGDFQSGRAAAMRNGCPSPCRQCAVGPGPPTAVSW